MLVSIKIDISESFYIGSALFSLRVEFYDHILDINFFTGESELQIVVKRIVFVIGGTAEFLVNCLPIKFLRGSGFLNDTIGIFVDDDNFSINHNACSLFWE